ncbi:unnamed protein product [Mytilus edulis]|uniref:Uncharacterized protein n=1 Tax=Mytilus edulis TaxID=6550 RepID=A0A8S3QVH4_MYTED|nr:unnamed protein product [Mytilus edulis]
MDINSVSLGTFPNESEGLVIQNTCKRKHSDSVDDNENTKKQKIDLQSDQAEDDIKDENKEELVLQSENDVIPENKEVNVGQTHSKENEGIISISKDDAAISLNQENERRDSDASSPKGIDTINQNEDSRGSAEVDPKPLKRPEAVTYFLRNIARLFILICRKTFSTKLASIKNRSKRYRNGIQTIVKIDVNNLPLNVNLIDLTEKHLREDHELPNRDAINKDFHRFAESHGEVLLEGHVPSDCLEYA